MSVLVELTPCGRSYAISEEGAGVTDLFAVDKVSLRPERMLLEHRIREFEHVTYETHFVLQSG